MEFRKDGDGYVLALYRGEELFGVMHEFLERTGIKGGEFQAVGAVDQVTLGFFHVDKKEYDWKTFQEELEVVSLLGTITETGLHAHGVFSDAQFRAWGGHVKEARVSVTMEIFLKEHKKIRRRDDPKSGLKLVEL